MNCINFHEVLPGWNPYVYPLKYFQIFGLNFWFGELLLDFCIAFVVFSSFWGSRGGGAEEQANQAQEQAVEEGET